MLNRNFHRLGLILACLVLLCACSDEKGGSSQDAEQKTNTEKWNSYVRLFNEADSILKSGQEYFESLGTGEEPVLDTRETLGPPPRWLVPVGNRTEGLRKIVEASLRVTDEKPASDLDAPAKAYAQALQTLLACLEEARGYYTAKSYTDDNFAKGREIHTRMLAAFGDATTKWEAFAVAMDAQNRKNQLAEAKSMRADGMKIVPAAIDFNIIAHEAMEELTRQGLNEDTVHNLDAAAFAPFYDRLVAGLEALEKEGAVSKQVEKEKLFESRVKNLVTSAREIKASASDIKEKAAKGAPEPQEGPRQVSFKNMGVKDTPEDFQDLLNSYVQAYNMMIGQRKSR